LLFDPGMGWRYSNIGYLLLRLVIERVTGSSLREALHQLVIDPLALRDTTVITSLAELQACSPGFSATFVDAGKLGDVRPLYDPGWVSHGLVGATASDVARLFDALVGGRIVGAPTLDAMSEPVLVRTEHRWIREPAYGLGVMIDAGSPYGLVVGHAGGGPGYATAAFHFPDIGGQAVTVVALANRDHDEIGVEIAFALAQRFEQQALR
jgi:D-alanyl-D-alanine carboxypeptidase